MGDICRNASGVYIWLGEEPGNISLLSTFVGPHPGSFDNLHILDAKSRRSALESWWDMLDPDRVETLKCLVGNTDFDTFRLTGEFYLHNAYW